MRRRSPLKVIGRRREQAEPARRRQSGPLALTSVARLRRTLRGVRTLGDAGSSPPGSTANFYSGTSWRQSESRTRATRVATRRQKSLCVAGADKRTCPRTCPETPKSDRTERTSEHVTAANITQCSRFRGTSNPRVEVRLLPGPPDREVTANPGSTRSPYAWWSNRRTRF